MKKRESKELDQTVEETKEYYRHRAASQSIGSPISELLPLLRNSPRIGEYGFVLGESSELRFWNV
jgi:hypothetical protein